VSEADRDDKTEDPTPQRLDEMWRDGRVVVGKDLTLGLSLLAAGGALAAIGSPLARSLTTAVTMSVTMSSVTRASARDGLADLLSASIESLLLVALLIAVVAVLGGVVGLAQTKAGLWFEKLAPDPSRLFSVEKLTHVFTKDFAVDLVLAMFKATAIGGSVWLVWRSDMLNLTDAARSHATSGLFAWSGMMPRGALAAGGALTAIGAIDYFIQRDRFLKKARMTKDEVKREHKNDEGDPLIKSRRRRKHRELAQGRISRDVPTADALIVNPTHIAIAIRYRRGEDRAPRVVCKGKGARADRMREVARESGVPIYRDVPLARLLYKAVKIGREVPETSYRAVAVVLATIYRTTTRRASQPSKKSRGQESLLDAAQRRSR
jgi:flagellar biosynthetic protein FlhB